MVVVPVAVGGLVRQQVLRLQPWRQSERSAGVDDLAERGAGGVAGRPALEVRDVVAGADGRVGVQAQHRDQPAVPDVPVRVGERDVGDDEVPRDDVDVVAVVADPLQVGATT